MVRKKNKRHNQSTPSATSASAEETQSESLIVTATELQELVRQGLIVDEVHEVLEYDRKNMPWIDNFVHASMELENQCNDPREKAFHALMRELFGMKAFRETSIQAGLISKAQDFGNKIDNRISDFIIQMGEGKKGWLSRRSVAILRQMSTTKRVIDLLNIAKNKGPETRGQIIIF
ncbi:14302_t:CDS:1 [Funneliformis caledonium]|uniref:14302_t:CDS:1 n=1 Tax=Funneliformis caledonium TaxID=1117310 RepID=A0A9N9HTR6_9GLOM|nr:14302_t:CDS:1 [Funneliformis caledonium]